MLFGFRLLCLHCRRSFLINRPISPFCWWTLLRKLLAEGGFMWCTFSFRSKAGIQRVNVNSKVNEVFCWYVYIGGIERASEYRHSKLRSDNSDISCVFIEPGFYDAEGRYNLLRHASAIVSHEYRRKGNMLLASVWTIRYGRLVVHSTPLHNRVVNSCTAITTVRPTSYHLFNILSWRFIALLAHMIHGRCINNLYQCSNPCGLA